MNEYRLIKHKSMIHSKTYTEEEIYLDDIGQPKDDMKCNICEKGIFNVSKLMIHNTHDVKINKQEIKHPDTHATK